MAIQIPPDVEVRIRQKVESSDFPDAGEVIREAMRLLDEQERDLADLRAKLQIGIDQLDRGEGNVFTPQLMKQIREDVAQRFAAHADSAPFTGLSGR